MESLSEHETSNIQLASKIRPDEEQLNFNPFQELGLRVDPNDKKDMDELTMILMGILNFPSDELAEHHA